LWQVICVPVRHGYKLCRHRRLRLVTRPSPRLYPNILDMGVYHRPVQSAQEIYPFRKNQSIPLVALDKSRLTFSVLILVILLMAIPMPAYSSPYSVDQLRLYTHSRVVSFKEFICIDAILWKESKYNYLARNGSHYGIGQMRSKHYQSKDPYTQIDLTIAYTHKRYVTMCNALAFHKRHGYY
jgi:hypothetical protein